jgi:hypothetical protein
MPIALSTPAARDPRLMTLADLTGQAHSPGPLHL